MAKELERYYIDSRCSDALGKQTLFLIEHSKDDQVKHRRHWPFEIGIDRIIDEDGHHSDYIWLRCFPDAEQAYDFFHRLRKMLEEPITEAPTNQR